jgi:hypothetical protein
MLFFTLILAIWLIVDPFGPQLLPILTSKELLSRTVERIPLAVSGWLFPILSLVIFMLWFLLRRKQTGGPDDKS